jgi:HTH-type transcriptional regulator/antitoxin HigA
MNEAVRKIKTQAQYDAAFSRLSALMDQELVPGSSAEDEFEALTVFLGDYERSKVAPAIPDPIESILFSLDQQKLKPKDLKPLIGSMSKVSEVLARKRPLSLAMIRALHKGLGIPAEVLIAPTAQDHADIDSAPIYEFLKFPLAEMQARKCFVGFVGSVTALKEVAEEQIKVFMGDLFGTRAAAAMLRAPLHQGGSRKMDEHALLAWWVCVVKKARTRKVAAKYKNGSITSEWLRDLAKLSCLETGPRLAQEVLAKAGIVLVIERHFTKTYLDGAAMFDDGTPIVALTLRHDRIDNFWFALMHELIHVAKHLTPGKDFIADNLEDKTRSSDEEQEADDEAQKALIPQNEWYNSKVRTTFSNEHANELADQLRIHPAIVAGRVRLVTGNWRLLSNLIGKSGDVTKHFADQL